MKCNWLLRLFGSERSVKEMKPLCSERGGNFCTEKSNKEKKNSDKGELNINVSYRTNGISEENKETFKGAAVMELISSIVTLAVLYYLLTR